MEILKKRGMAALVAALVIFGSTLLNVNRTLGSESQKVMDGFYDGVYDASWSSSRPSISSKLTERIDAANGLVAVAATFDGLSSETAGLRDARNTLIGAVSLQEKFGANQALEKAFYVVTDALEELELTDKQVRMVEEYTKNFRGAQYAIDNAKYNESVREFERNVLNIFPTNILYRISFVDPPEYFE